MAHDSMRNGAAAVLATVCILEGTVISMCEDCSRQQEWPKLLRVLDDVAPPHNGLHMIADSCATHEHP